MSASRPVTSSSIGLGRQLAGEPDGLAGEVDVAGVALVEDQVEHAQHRGDVTGLVEPHPRDGPFGPADPLGHRRLRHEVGLRDLTRGQAADRAQREGDGRSRRQGWVRAQEVQLERVVHHPRPGLARVRSRRGPRGAGEKYRRGRRRGTYARPR